MKKIWGITFISCLFLLTSCGGQGANTGQMDYEETKRMMVDILKSDEGKKAFEEIMTDEEMQTQLVMDQKIVSQAIEENLTSDKGMDFWKKAFADPKFAEAVAKSMQKENENLLKDLMKDPEYRDMMIEVLKDPELAKATGDLLKSQEFRQHLQTVVIDTFESPLFKAKLQDVLLKAAEEMGDGQQQQGGEEGGGQAAGGGGGGGGDGGGGGGGA
ncbi:spore germination protein D [Bacillus oleivorans]|uniref:Spore germination protein D n=1 Tax=Bacillus oleivorans TaxID=1448271 RepID=A0A285D7I9_9BACI|nr:spore germination lipoprotein GerD [Bacillus oleivorans]SNX75595.1 spore germination protein D [Bacillus oleivorans]